MSNDIIMLQKDLESIKKVDNGFEYWSARDLMPVLGYEKWQKFAEVIKRVVESVKSAGIEVTDHFTGADKMVVLGSGSQRKFEKSKYWGIK